MGNAQPPSLMEPLLRLSDKKVDYDPVKFQYLGSANSEASLCVLRKDAAVKSFKDVLTTEAIVGGSGSSTIDYPLTHNAVLGTKFKVIAGFKGTRDLSLAMKRGEVQGLCGLFWSSLNTLFPDWRTAGEINIIVQEATKGEPELLKMGVPTVYDFAKEAEQRQAMDLMYKPLVFGRPFVMPPETPADRLAALRTAFDKVMKDPDLLADAKKLRIPIQPTTGAEVQELVKALYAIPTGVVDKLRKELIAQRK
jgi:tripartite-type tricarboxylate transporter receptor subunit TctC